MTLKGIDISNNNGYMQPSALDIDFCICKATEGVGFTDSFCDGFIQDCINANKLWGFYHFARENEPEAEAEYFYQECKGYFGHGVPVLDYETTNYNNVEWCERFLQRLHDLSGIWAMLYISASRTPEYNGSWIPQNCGLWLAGYPYDATQWAVDECPYDCWPWEFIAIWQFTSSLELAGHAGRLDGNYAYMDMEAWGRYAGVSDTTQEDAPGSIPDEKSCKELAREVVKGKWGNGWNRKNALDSTFGEGTYEHVQDLVNRGDY